MLVITIILVIKHGKHYINSCFNFFNLYFKIIVITNICIAHYCSRYSLRCLEGILTSSRSSLRRSLVSLVTGTWPLFLRSEVLGHCLSLRVRPFVFSPGCPSFYTFVFRVLFLDVCPANVSSSTSKQTCSLGPLPNSHLT